MRWHLHELDPATESTTRGFRRLKAYALVDLQPADKTGTIARLARDLTVTIREPERARTTHQHARPALLAVPGCAALTATKIVGETTGVDRFANTDAFARYNGTAPFTRLVLQHAPSQAVTH